MEHRRHYHELGSVVFYAYIGLWHVSYVLNYYGWSNFSCTLEGGLNKISKNNIKSGRCFKRTIQIPPIFSKMHRIPRFYEPFCKHALFTFDIQIVSKQSKRFGNDFSKEQNIFEVFIKHPSHGRIKIELFVNVMIFVNSLINTEFTKKCNIPQWYAHCLHKIKNNGKGSIPSGS